MDIPKRTDDDSDLPGTADVVTTDSGVIDLGPLDIVEPAPFSPAPAVARAPRPKQAAKKRAKPARKPAARKKAGKKAAKKKGKSQASKRRKAVRKNKKAKKTAKRRASKKR
jgi:hypothetical protein